MLNDLEKKFVNKGKMIGQTLILRQKDAIEMINDARKEEREILGIDSFVLDSKGTNPQLEHSIDFSSDRDEVSDSWSEAIEFID